MKNPQIKIIIKFYLYHSMRNSILHKFYQCIFCILKTLCCETLDQVIPQKKKKLVLRLRFCFKLPSSNKKPSDFIVA
jgi:hypothetical protein